MVELGWVGLGSMRDVRGSETIFDECVQSRSSGLTVGGEQREVLSIPTACVCPQPKPGELRVGSEQGLGPRSLARPSRDHVEPGVPTGAAVQRRDEQHAVGDQQGPPHGGSAPGRPEASPQTSAAAAAVPR